MKRRARSTATYFDDAQREVEEIRARVAERTKLKEWSFRRIARETGIPTVTTAWRFVRGQSISIEAFLAIRSWIERLDEAERWEGR